MPQIGPNDLLFSNWHSFNSIIAHLQGGHRHLPRVRLWRKTILRCQFTTTSRKESMFCKWVVELFLKSALLCALSWENSFDAAWLSRLIKFFYFPPVQSWSSWRTKHLGVFWSRNLPHDLRSLYWQYQLRPHNSFQRRGQVWGPTRAGQILAAFSAKPDSSRGASR